jgi:hypothetical protein
MAFRHGRFAEISVNSHALSTFCDNADLKVDVDTSDTTTFTKTWKTNVVGAAGGSVELAGDYDPTDSTGPIIVLTDLIGADPFPVILYPGGNTSGQISHTFDAILTSFSESSPAGGKVTFKATLLVDDDITTAVI